MNNIINMYTNSKGVTSTLQFEVEQVNKHFEIDITKTIEKVINGERVSIEQSINLNIQELSRIIDAAMSVAKPNKRIITIKQKQNVD